MEFLHRCTDRGYDRKIDTILFMNLLKTHRRSNLVLAREGTIVGLHSNVKEKQQKVNSFGKSASIEETKVVVGTCTKTKASKSRFSKDDSIACIKNVVEMVPSLEAL